MLSLQPSHVICTWIVGEFTCTSLSRPCLSADTTCFSLRLHLSIHVVNRASQRFAVSLGVGTDAQRARIAAALVTQQHNIFRWGQARELPWPMCWQRSSPMYVHLGASNTPSRSPSTHCKHLNHLQQFSIGAVHAGNLSWTPSSNALSRLPPSSPLKQCNMQVKQKNPRPDPITSNLFANNAALSFLPTCLRYKTKIYEPKPMLQ